jgi:hypothetical protein
VDVVFDEYIKDSLKSATREQRGSGGRLRVMATVKTPSNWQKFLRVDENKRELFTFLSNQVVQNGLTVDADIVATVGEEAICVRDRDLSSLMPCTHEEADTRIMIHCRDAVIHGHRSITIRTVDSDVVFISIAVFDSLNAEELWIAFGTGKNYRFIPVHEIVENLGFDVSKSMAFFHAFTGCDTVSSFAGRGKKIAYDVWQAFPQITETFKTLGNNPAEITEEQVNKLQRYVSLLYDRTSALIDVNECRKYLFSKRGRSYDSIPPTKAALLQHIRRAVYQGGHVWGQCTTLKPLLPNPCDWGWLHNGRFVPNWTLLPQVASCCEELIHCRCKVACRGLCACHRAGLKCTALCDCDGDCQPV